MIGRTAYRLSLCLAAVSCGCSYQPFTMGFPGTFATKQYFDAFEFLGHDAEFTVYYPDADPPSTGFPIVVFNAGWNQPRTTNEALCRQLAQWGMVVINRQFPSHLNPYYEEHIAHNTLVLDWALAENIRPDSPLMGMIDGDSAAVSGYSLGAGIALGAAAREPRFKACVAIDALGGDAPPGYVAELARIEGATLYIRSTYPNFFGTPADLFEHTPPPAMQVDIVGASHMQFEDRIVGLNQLGPLVAFPNGPADPAETRAIATRYTVAWLKVFLEGDASFVRYLTGDDAQEDVDAGLVELRSAFTDDSRSASR